MDAPAHEILGRHDYVAIVVIVTIPNAVLFYLLGWADIGFQLRVAAVLLVGAVGGYVVAGEVAARKRQYLEERGMLSRDS